MCAIVLASAHYQCNPDNISTPIAASLGDSITLGILSIVGSLLFHIPGSNIKIRGKHSLFLQHIYLPTMHLELILVQLLPRQIFDECWSPFLNKIYFNYLVLIIWCNVFLNISDKNTQIWICSVVIGLLVLVIPPLLIYSWHNRYARPAVLQGWVPILLAMFISSGVGIIMSKVAEKYQSVVAFLPIING